MSDDIEQFAPYEPEPSTEQAEDNRPRWIVWLTLLVVFTVFAVLPKVSTNLGVEAPRYDKSGHEHVWRIWWRARHAIVDFGPPWGFTLVYIGLAIAFVILSALAVWIALVPNDRPELVAEQIDAEPTATP
jgi:hypothetical protein